MPSVMRSRVAIEEDSAAAACSTMPPATRPVADLAEVEALGRCTGADAVGVVGCAARVRRFAQEDARRGVVVEVAPPPPDAQSRES